MVGLPRDGELTSQAAISFTMIRFFQNSQFFYLGFLLQKAWEQRIAEEEKWRKRRKRPCVGELTGFLGFGFLRSEAGEGDKKG